jgi:hypothetical protein
MLFGLRLKMLVPDAKLDWVAHMARE